MTLLKNSVSRRVRIDLISNAKFHRSVKKFEKRKYSAIIYLFKSSRL